MINRVREMLKHYDLSLAKHSIRRKSHMCLTVAAKTAETGRCEKLTGFEVSSVLKEFLNPSATTLHG